jgi:hypothetical protein
MPDTIDANFPISKRTANASLIKAFVLVCNSRWFSTVFTVHNFITITTSVKAQHIWLTLKAMFRGFQGKTNHLLRDYCGSISTGICGVRKWTLGTDVITQRWVMYGMFYKNLP